MSNPSLNDLCNTMNKNADWQALKPGTAFRTSKDGVEYVKACMDAGTYIFDVRTGMMEWAPAVIDFRRPLYEQIILASLWTCCDEEE